MKFILGKKLVMTQIFKADGTVVPVTAVLASPNVITQIKNQEKDHYIAVQVGFDRAKHQNKPQAGHLKGLDKMRVLREFLVTETEAASLKRGDVIGVDAFSIGDAVKVVGISKGKGFQGVVKRHGFHGHPASHGHKDQLRMPGSIGAGGVQRVFKGVRMAGRMGNDQVTIDGLTIVDIDQEKNILYVKGALPGAKNSLLLISAAGELKVRSEKAETKSEAVVPAPVEEVASVPVAAVSEEEKK